MALRPGEKLGPYEVIEAIGKGGMGEVYRVRDTRLGRDVALKVSAERFGERFEREARTVASLNHPNVCTLHDVGPNYLVMELVEGVTLAERIQEGPLPLNEALHIARQIVDALDAAHEKGITHRDLKPGNIKIKPDGTVKVLDFGLAKVVAGAVAVGNIENSPTMSMEATQAGVILGTAAYMSPEQARGKEVDKRADIWAFGVVLFEMVTGRRLFQGEDLTDTLASVVKVEPDLSAAPLQIRRLLKKCLEKDPRRRLRDISSAALLLEETPAETTAEAEGRPASRRWLASAAIVLLAVVAGAVGGRTLFQSPPRQAPPDLSTYKFTPLSRDEATERTPAWSPDGKSIAYTASVNGVLQVFTKAIGATQAAQITRVNNAATRPLWSPDSSSIYFHSENAVWSVSPAGGSPERLFDQVGGFAPHPDGKRFLIGRSGKFLIASPGAKEEEPLLYSSELDTMPQRAVIGFSPDGTKIAVVAAGDVWILPFPSDSKASRRIPVGGARLGSWMPDSRRLILHREIDDNSLVALDTASGDIRVIYRTLDALATPAVSPDGKRIAYSGGRTEWSLLEIGIPDGRVRTLRGSGATSWFPDWAPSGTHYLYATDSSGKWTIEDVSAGESFSRRLNEVDSAFSLVAPRWSPDGSRFAFLWNSTPVPRLMLANASGGPPTPLDPRWPGPMGGFLWSPDGQWIV
jgi:serine/threonine protein kinase